MSDDVVFDPIRSVRIFALLSDGDCEALARAMRVRRLVAGEVLFRRGATGDSMVVIAEGTLSVRISRFGGSEVEIARVGGGEVVGEMSCIDPAPRSATVVAEEPTLVYEFDRKGLAEMRRDAPAAAVALVGAVVRDVTRRLREVDRRIADELVGVPAAAKPSGATTDSTRSWRTFLQKARGGE